MIEQFYGLRTDAFSLSPDLGFLYESKAHEEAVAHLLYGLEQNEDIILIAGDIGTGKTLALQRLLDQLSSVYVPVSITVTTMGFDEILRYALLKLEAPADRAAGTAELVHLFEQQLVAARARGRKILLVVDEAQDMPLDVLEGTRLLLNLARPGSQSLQLILVGQLGLRIALSRPELRQLRQRIRVEYRVGRLDRKETEAYVAHRLRVAGREEPLFTAEAMDRIYELSRGVPRLVNHLAGKAMVAGYVDEAKRIKAQHVEDLDEADEAATATVQVPAAEAVAAGLPADAAPAGPTREPRPAMASRRRRAQGSRAPFFAGAAAVIAVVLAAVTYPVWSVHLPTGAAPAPAPRTAVIDSPAAATQDTLAAAVADTTAADSLALAAASAATGDSTSTYAATPVVASPETEAAPDAPSPRETVPVGAFAAHVASFGEVGKAGALLATIEAQGFPSFVETKLLSDGSEWHRVYVGPFADRAAARGASEELMRRRLVDYFQVYPVAPR